MRSSSWKLLLSVMLVSFSLGASCDKGAGSAPAAREEPAGAALGERIEALEQVATDQLTGSERRVWADLANELLSPCGDPVSVARCVAEARACRACVPAARYLVRLVAEGYQQAEIEGFYAARFDDKKAVTIDTADAPLKGATMASVTIVEFSDFECPYCSAAHPQLAAVLSELEGKVSLAFKHYPLDGHKNAQPAARAAVAAQLQGKFWPMADALFEHQRELSPEKIRELAASIGLDMARFDADVASAEVQARIDADRREGAELEIQGTPTLFVNGRRYQEPLANLKKYLREELDR